MILDYGNKSHVPSGVPIKNMVHRDTDWSPKNATDFVITSAKRKMLFWSARKESYCPNKILFVSSKYVCLNFPLTSDVFIFGSLRYWGYLAPKFHMVWSSWAQGGFITYLDMHDNSPIQNALTDKLNAKPIEGYITPGKVSLYSMPGIYMLIMVVLHFMLLILTFFTHRRAILNDFIQLFPTFVTRF